MRSTKHATPEALRKFIEELYTRGTVRGEDGGEFEIFPTSVTPDRGAFIRDICRAEGATRALEIGMAWGASTLHILEALLGNSDKPRHVVVDRDQTSVFRGAGRRLLREAGVADFVDLHEDKSELFLPMLVRDRCAFQFIFVDGAHDFDDVFVDFFYINRLLRPGAVVVFDDTFADSIHFVCRTRKPIMDIHLWRIIRPKAAPSTTRNLPSSGGL